MTQTEAAVLLATEQHLLEAAVTTRGHRLLEVLNDPTTDFLPVLGVRLVSHDMPESALAMRKGIVRRSNLVLALLTDHHEAPERRQYSFVEKKTRSVVVVAGGYLIQGELQLRGSDDPVSVINAELQNFFPVTNAIVSRPVGLITPLRAPVAIVNKQCVSALHIGETPLAADLAPLHKSAAAGVRVAELGVG